MMKEIRKETQTGSTFALKKNVLMHVFVLFLLLGCGFLSYRLPWNALFPIREIEISGANLTDHQLLRQQILPFVKDGFFSVRVSQIKERLLSTMPWVDDAYVRLGWPNTVFINLYEKQPIAIWNNSALLDSTGELFTVPQITSSDIKNLPYFYGEQGKQEMVFYIYKQIAPLLLPLSSVVKISLQEDLYWDIQLQNGVVIYLGMQDMMTTLSRFIKVYPKMIGEHADAVEYVDLRYVNGIAIRWKKIDFKTSKH